MIWLFSWLVCRKAAWWHSQVFVFYPIGSLFAINTPYRTMIIGLSAAGNSAVIQKLSMLAFGGTWKSCKTVQETRFKSHQIIVEMLFLK